MVRARSVFHFSPASASITARAPSSWSVFFGTDEVGATGEDGAGLARALAGTGKKPILPLRSGLSRTMDCARPGTATICATRPFAKTPDCGEVFLVGVDRAVAQGLQFAVEVHAAQGGLGVQGARPGAALAVLGAASSPPSSQMKPESVYQSWA